MPALIVICGLPGAGKSTVADAIASDLGCPVFAKDILEASLIRSGACTMPEGAKSLGLVGYELMTTLAGEQLGRGQSVVLDSVAGRSDIRSTWRELAGAHQANWRVIECICGDENLHRTRIEGRTRNIPGWPELTWEDVQRSRQLYELWEEEHLVLDAGADFNTNVSHAQAYLSAA